MSLLPQTHQEFSSPDYWDRFFKKRGAKAFEWYGDYGQLSGILHKYIKPADNMLVVGCGNSTLCEDLYDMGYHQITNIDISDVVIRQMTDRNAARRPAMKFIKMDLLKMEFSDSQFSVVLDKGTLDALMSQDSDGINLTIDQMFDEIGRVLRIGGRYLCVTLAQDHILKKLLQYFPENGWMVRVCRVMEQEDTEGRGFNMPVFVFVFTKFKKMPNMKPLLEVAYFEDQVERVESAGKLLDSVKTMQNYAILRQQLNSKSLCGEQVALEWFSAGSSAPRYTVYIVDGREHKPANKYGIFIVPEGRETEWLFSTDSGRSELAKSAGFERLLVVSLHRDHQYGSLDSVKAELSGKVMELAPPNIGKKQVPFLSVGDDICCRTVCHRGHSEMSGDYVVEDVEVDGQTFRRLVYLSNRNIQSEAKVTKEIVKKKGGKKKTKVGVDTNYLSIAYHKAMTAGLAFVHNFSAASAVDLLFVGLGGGSLPVFLHKNYPQLHLEIVELDPEMVTIATSWFGFQQDERMRVKVCDGLDYITEAAAQGRQYRVVILDVDGKDRTAAISGPPKPFVKPDFLKSINNILHPEGVLMLNLVCRDKDLRKSLIQDLKSVFKAVYAQKFEEDINEVLFVLPSSREGEVEQSSGGALPPMLTQALEGLQDSLNRHRGTSDVPTLIQELEGLSLL